MTHYESAIDEIAGRLQGTDASLTSSIAEILAAALQELIEAELTGTIGAESGERTPTRVAQRNGHRSKLLSTPAGDLEVGIPKLRKGSFFPELLEPRQRIDKALWASDHDRLHHRDLHEEGRRSGQGAGLRHGDLEVVGEQDL